MAKRKASSGEAFAQLLVSTLLPQFCSDPTRLCDVSGFRGSPNQLSEEDAHYFLLAWKAKLIEHHGGGRYRSIKGAATEQLFWEGPKKSNRRTFTLWLEPFITVGALARLHFNHGWPANLIGTQSTDWAFDVVTFLPGSHSEFIAGEVKKTVGEVDELIRFMTLFGSEPKSPEPASGKPRNAFKKMSALRSRRAPLFWVLGPEGYSRVQQVSYRESGVVNFTETAECFLDFPR